MKRIALTICSLMLIFVLTGPVSGRDYYKTYDVVEVTEKTFVIERVKKDSVDRFEIDLSRRPDIKKGDKVRYDKTRDRLRKTIKAGPEGNRK